jgi:signal transduction histidine kinase
MKRFRIRERISGVEARAGVRNGVLVAAKRIEETGLIINMSTTAKAIAIHLPSSEKSRDPSRFRSTGEAAPVTIESMDEPNAATELDSADAEVSAQTLGQLGAQFAHDFNNVLAVVLTSVEMAIRVGDPAKANVFLANALKIIARGRTLTDRLAAASYASEAPVRLDARAVVERVVAEAAESAPAGTKITSALEADRSTIHIDPRFFETALRNLIANAIAAVGGTGTVTVSTRNVGGADIRAEAGREYLLVAVRDTGRGIAEDVRHQAFDLFFTTGAAESQRGIGLTQAKDAVRRAGGVVTIESAVGQGTTVTLAIPLATA